jgi:signal transduction histidine kinase/DNA-binding NarL/FixJ family response regulator
MDQGNGSQAGRLLIIDDNRSIHDDFHKILGCREEDTALIEAEAAFLGKAATVTPRITYEIDDAFQGQEGLELVVQALHHERPYDVAFVDMRMPPGWDGAETIERLWERDPDLQIVMCTAYSDYTWTEIIERLGCNDKLLILKKPFDNVEVSQLAVALTEKRRLARQANLKMEQLEALVDLRTQKLQEANLEVERLLSAISSLLIGIDSEGVVRRWNTSAEILFNIIADEAINKLFDSLHIDWVNRDNALSLISISSVNHEIQHEIEFYDRYHTTRLLGLSVYPVKESGQICGILILGRDITEQRLLELKVQQTQKLESIGQLAAGVAHEINTPIQFVSGNLDFLQQGFNRLEQLLDAHEALVNALSLDQCPEASLQAIETTKEAIKLDFVRKEVPQAFTEVIDGINRVAEIVQAMKSFSHPGTQHKTAIDLNKAIFDTITVSRHEWQRIAEIKTDLASDLPLVPCLLGEFNQVILNLIVNATHAIGDVVGANHDNKGTITIRTSYDESWVRVEVCDTGAGIPVAIQRRIFDPFFTTKEVGKGTGQGLAIAHNIIVNKHEGNLTFETQNKKGTTFYIDLPLYDIQNISL